MVSDDSALDMSFASIAGERSRLAEADRERHLKRVGAGVAVVLLHILFLAALLTAGYVKSIRHPPKPVEVVYILPPLPHPSQTRPVVPVSPTLAPHAPPAPIHTLPITPPPAQNPPRSQADILQQIGKELACGAGPYEHLSQAEREVCKRQPWKFKKNAKGVIVLDVTAQPPPQTDEPALSGSDAERHQQETADPCLAAGNTHSECIHKKIFGR